MKLPLSRFLVSAIALPFFAACSAGTGGDGLGSGEDDIKLKSCPAGYTLEDANADRDEAARLAQYRFDGVNMGDPQYACGYEASQMAIAQLASKAAGCGSIGAQIARGGSEKDQKPGWKIREALQGTLGVAYAIGTLHSGNPGTVAKELAGATSKDKRVTITSPIRWEQGIMQPEEILEFHLSGEGKSARQEVTIKSLVQSEDGDSSYKETEGKYWVTKDDKYGVELTITDEKSPARYYYLQDTSFLRMGVEDPFTDPADQPEGFEYDGHPLRFSIFAQECGGL